jgi:hypothetical protein
MRCVLVLVCLVSTVHAEIIPAGGKLPPEPSVWVELPTPKTKITVTDGADALPFRLDTRRMQADGREWVAIYIGAVAGKVIVSAGGARAAYTIDTSLKPDPVGDWVQFMGVALERIGGRDQLVVEAIASRGTVMFFLNHDAPEPKQYVWIGRADANHRFTIPIARLGMRCDAPAKKITLSLYSNALLGSETLYPLTTLEVDRGKTKLPVGIVSWDAEQAKAWEACPGARFEVPRVQTYPGRGAPPR